MLGPDGNDGLIGRSIHKMFDDKRVLETLSKGETKVRISVELLEVYNEKVRDLLSNVNDQDLKVTSCEVVGNKVLCLAKVEVEGVRGGLPRHVENNPTQNNVISSAVTTTQLLAESNCLTR